MVVVLGTHPRTAVQQAVVAFVATGTPMPGEVVQSWAPYHIMTALESCMGSMRMTDSQAQRANMVEDEIATTRLPIYRGMTY